MAGCGVIAQAQLSLPTYTECMTPLVSYQRRYELDWLRVIAFGCLIFYHIGMFYVSWDWHVKSVHAGAWAEPVMRLVNPWRLSLLFLISGVAVRYAIDKASLGTFASRRFWRLFVPLTFGVLVIVAPQSWLELAAKGETTKGFVGFYPDYLLGKFSIVTPTWNHLWYVAYILVYTLLVAPISRPLSRFMGGVGGWLSERVFAGKMGVAAVVLIPAVPHLIYRIFLDPYHPTSHDLVDDWANHAHSATTFMLGFLIAKEPAFWKAVDRALPLAALLTVAMAIWLSVVWYDWEVYSGSGRNLWPARVGRVLYLWLAPLTLLGLANRHLNRPSRTLTYMAEAVFPWYILHQTLIVMAGYWLTRQSLTAPLEFLALTGTTLAGCYVLHELVVRRVKLLRLLFGMRA